MNHFPSQGDYYELSTIDFITIGIKKNAYGNDIIVKSQTNIEHQHRASLQHVHNPNHSKLRLYQM